MSKKVYQPRTNIVWDEKGDLVTHFGLALVYADYINILGGSIHTIKKKTETLLVISKEIGLDVNADKTKYMVMLKSDCRIKSQYKD